MNTRQIQFLFCLLTLASLTNCGKKNEFVPPPPPQVDVLNPIVKDVTVYVEGPARTEGSLRVEIRARVKGLLKTVDFKAGQYVEKGKLLFTIEPEEYEAAVATANGNLDTAKADLEVKETDYERKKKVFEGNQAVSELDVLKAEADVKMAKALIQVRTAELSNAKRELTYTKITAPMAGRASLQEVDQGSLVGSSEPTLLTTVIQDNPIFVSFEVNERRILRFLKDRPTKGKRLNLPQELRLTLSNDEDYSEKGRFNFLDNEVDTGTGTIRVRAEFGNKKGALAAGLFVRIGVPNELEKAVLIPETAIQRDLGGSYVLLLGEGNKVVRRNVKVTEFSEGDLKILEPLDEAGKSGLKPGDRIIVSNLQRVRAGGIVSLAAKTPAKVSEKD